MELAGYIFLTLLGGGYYLNKDQDDPRSEHQKQNTKQKNNPALKYICNTNNKMNKMNKMNKNIENIQNVEVPDEVVLPQEIGEYVTPYFYNTLELTGAVKKIPNSRYDPKMIFSGLDPEMVKNIVTRYRKNKKKCGPIWNNLTMDDKYETIPTAVEDEDKDEQAMVHTNMVPFYKGSITQNVDPENRLNAHKLELYTGTYHLRKDNKEEVTPFFAPTQCLGNIYGNFTQDREMDRYKPSNTGKKNNELPFNQIKVGPGLNKGYTAEPSGGFHDPLRVLPKPNTDLYINPKMEMEGRTLTGKAPTENRTATSVQYKYKPTLLVENKCGERNFTTVGAVTARKLRPDVVMKETNRKHSMQVMGPAGPGETNFNRTEDMFAKVQKSRKVNFLNTKYRNAVQAEGKRVNDYGKSGIENTPTERAVTGVRTYWSNLKKAISNMMNQYTDTAKYTRRQEYIKNSRVAGNAKIQQPSRGPAYDPKDVAKTTIRETTEDNKHLGPSAKLGAGRSQAYDPTSVARTTIRQTTENNNHLGPSGKLGAGKSQAYDPRNITKTTIRETTENNNHLGPTGKLGAGKSQAYDPRNITKTTIRETTENNNHLGPSGKLGAGKSQAYDPRNITKTTIRETTENNNHLGPSGKLGAGKSQAYDPRNITKTTVRETTENNNHLGPTGKLGAGKSQAYDPRNITKTTVRETTENNNRLGPSGKLGAGKSQAYDPRNITKTTIRETTENNNHLGPSGKLGAGKSQAYDPRNITKTTIRETTENNNHLGPTGKLGAGRSKAYDPKSVAKTTIRETTENSNHLGPSGKLGAGRSKAYDPKSVAKTTIRETTENSNHLGPSGKLGAGRSQAYDPKAVAKTTIRETTENSNHLGPSGKLGAGKSQAYDPKNVTKTTIRETTENNDRLGITGVLGAGKLIAYDPTDVTRTTIRETTEDSKRIGNMGGNQFQNGSGYKVTIVDPKNTNRQFTSDNDYIGSAAPASKKKTISYESSYNMETNANREEIAKGRSPTKQSVKFANGVSSVLNYEVKKIEGDSINWRGNIKTSNVGDTFNPTNITPCTVTSIKNNVPSEYTRLDVSILDAYKDNPLTQSLNSYA